MPIFQKFQKVIKNVFRIMKPHLYSRPFMILKRLDENVADAILSYIYYTTISKFQKSIKTLCDRQTKHKP